MGRADHRVRAAGLVLVLCALAGAGRAGAQADPSAPLVSLAHKGAWSAQPSAGQIEAAKPAGLNGRAVASISRCSVAPDGALKGCVVTATPDLPAVRQAAQRLLPLYRFSPEDARILSAWEGTVFFTLSWGVEACEPPHCLRAPVGVGLDAPGAKVQEPPRR